MKTIHLTDEELQNYVLAAEACSEALLAHISQCKHCQQQAAQYKLLFEGIEKQEKAVFDFDIADIVMQSVIQEKIQGVVQPKPASYSMPWIPLIIAILVAMAGVIAYLFGSSFVNLFKYVQPLIASLVALTALGLTVFLGLDMYHKYKAQLKALNFG